MNVGQKMKAIKSDLRKIVGICNAQEDFNAASQAQQALTTVASSDKYMESSGTEIGEVEFK